MGSGRRRGDQRSGPVGAVSGGLPEEPRGRIQEVVGGRSVWVRSGTGRGHAGTGGERAPAGWEGRGTGGNGRRKSGRER